MNISSSNNLNNYSNDYDQYPEFLLDVKDHFRVATAGGDKLFTTTTENLAETFLSNLPSGARQHYNCRSCLSFINKFGGLVTITDKGVAKSAMWDEEFVPTFFKSAVGNMRELVENAKVDGVFVAEEKTLGQPRTGEWEHLSVVVPKEYVHSHRLLTPFQVMAEKKEDFNMFMNALREFNLDTVTQAVNLLVTDSLYRSEKVLGVAEFFKGVHESRNKVRNTRHKANLTWLAVANAPTGFTHVKSSMIGTLLEDIASGMSFQSVSNRFKEKMNPLQYQRPTAPPKAGNTARAEVIFKELGLEKALVRRFARLEELRLLWSPRTKKREVSTGGIFSHLSTRETTKEKPSMALPVKTMTWKKFEETVLPHALGIEYYVKDRENFSAILTAYYDDAPPILQWDKETQRNPFSWYVYAGGSSARNWNVRPGYVKVTGVTYQPSMWYGETKNQGKSVLFVLEGSKDSRHRGAGNALFPEILKSELREVRSTIEAYSRRENTLGYDEATANGIRLQSDNSNSTWNAKVRVTTETGTAVYILDRWD